MLSDQVGDGGVAAEEAYQQWARPRRAGAFAWGKWFHDKVPISLKTRIANICRQMPRVTLADATARMNVHYRWLCVMERRFGAPPYRTI